jgi:hypothetical protein
MTHKSIWKRFESASAARFGARRNKRSEIVNLVASGMEVEPAISEVLGATTTKDEAGRIK